MLSKNKIKLIQSLNRKKIREQEQIYLVEGSKIVLEAIEANLTIKLLIGTPDFFEANQIPQNTAEECLICELDELKKASLQQAPQQAIAVIAQNKSDFIPQQLPQELALALDFIQDPGNLGTIIRMADWFGIRHIFCSDNTVDCYNPKVIQASMGAIFRVQLHYINLEDLITQAANEQLPVYGTFLEGKNIYQATLSPAGILVMGNEGKGISDSVANKINQKIHIPSFAFGNGSESLNVATATAICCSEFKRRALED
ncbi:RNA methyltransferase [Sunxiuqinia elliptica]|uniref:TrmH family RNA methyltransferase n=1 Tax=Sunxiuqinia elliptica TaxID=655355 RepID=A0A4R6H6L3_9BACT|nr:RNA methyltransferase [Sunxiuqinia elliptica]TDO03095.1 TrmH family RNA methyltransferase [Sunxiuqinia elliptica]TDO59294.1 TrmH family RNA methyltransferase [Sunxiuqinia elliptica]